MSATRSFGIRVYPDTYHAFIGLAVGDALGAFVEFCDPTDPSVAAFVANPIMVDGGVWDIAAGQVTDDTEMCIALLSSIDDYGKYDHLYARDQYVKWAQSQPFDIGTQTRIALAGNGLNVPVSQANGAMPRAALIGAMAHVWYTKQQLREIVSKDCGITHGGAVVADTAYAIAWIVANAHRKVSVDAVLPELMEELHEDVRYWITGPSENPSPNNIGWCRWPLVSLIEALRAVEAGSTFDAEILKVVAMAGDSDTIAAVVGAGVASRTGLEGIRQEWRDCVLGCEHGKRKRPDYHPRIVSASYHAYMGPHDI
jgi:ADP-ribosyl-[dinitrogen reductase] hydrolase